LNYPTYERAAADARDFVASGWQAWVEAL
jgi:hypothetical protein